MGGAVGSSPTTPQRSAVVGKSPIEDENNSV